jgi:hypothetical protein
MGRSFFSFFDSIQLGVTWYHEGVPAAVLLECISISKFQTHMVVSCDALATSNFNQTFLYKGYPELRLA